jgi:hypothetical protein
MQYGELGGRKTFFSSPKKKVQIGSYSKVTGVYFPGSDVDHSPPISAEMKNEWIHTSSPPI